MSSKHRRFSKAKMSTKRGDNNRLSKKKRLKSVHSLCQASPGKSFAHPLCPAFKQRIFIAKSSASLWPRMQCALHKGKAIHTANTSTRVHLRADTMMATAYVKEIAYWTRQNMSGQHTLQFCISFNKVHQYSQAQGYYYSQSSSLLFTKLLTLLYTTLSLLFTELSIIIHRANIIHTTYHVQSY